MTLWHRGTMAALLLAWAAPAMAADLLPNTAAAFDRYVRLTEARIDRELRGEMPFLWADRLSGADKTDANARLANGEVVVRALETLDAGRAIDIPDGLRHHWIGTIFIPGVPVARVVSLMQNYDAYGDVYRPNVRWGKTTSHDGNRYMASVQLYMKKVISVVLNTDYDVRYVTVSPRQVHVRSYATRIAEVENADTSDAREKPVGHDSGFLWRFNNYCGIEARDAGTYVQCESVSLSRDVPFAVAWVVRPFVTGIPRESLEFTLRAMRTALTAPR